MVYSIRPKNGQPEKTNKTHVQYPALKRLQLAVNHLLDEFTLGVSTSMPQYSGAFHPHVDITETATQIIVTAEVPGLTPDDIELTTHEDRLYITGEKAILAEPDAIGYLHVERPHGRFDRTVLLPSAVDSDRAVATCKDGILRIVLPKSAERAHVAESIEIKRADNN